MLAAWESVLLESEGEERMLADGSSGAEVCADADALEDTGQSDE